jgi:hypothetical protein
MASSLGDIVLDAFRDDDVEAVQQLFKERTLTPTTLVTWDGYNPEDECTLLGVSSWRGLGHIFANIILAGSNDKGTTPPRFHEIADDQGRRKVRLAKQSEILLVTFTHIYRSHLPTGAFTWYKIWDQDELQSAVNYINIRKRALTSIELYMLLLGAEDAHHLKACRDAYLSWLPPGPDPFECIILQQVTDVFTKAYLVEELKVEEWAALISDAMARGLNLLSRPEQKPSTLTGILCCMRTSNEALDNIHRWIDMLELAGVDIEQHLQIETPRCVATWKQSASCHLPLRGHDTSIERTLQVGYSRGRWIPYWRENIDKSCLISELLMEFPRFLHPETMDIYTNAADAMRYHRA